jgi:hypothetical protein
VNLINFTQIFEHPAVSLDLKGGVELFEFLELKDIEDIELLELKALLENLKQISRRF